MSRKPNRRTFFREVVAWLPARRRCRPSRLRRLERPDIAYPRVFSGRQTKMIAFPLGGVGAGSLSLGGRGQLRDWEIFNGRTRATLRTMRFLLFGCKLVNPSPWREFSKPSFCRPMRVPAGSARITRRGSRGSQARSLPESIPPPESTSRIASCPSAWRSKRSRHSSRTTLMIPGCRLRCCVIG